MEKCHLPILSAHACLSLPTSTSAELGRRLASRAFDITSSAAEITAVARETLAAELWQQIGAAAGQPAARISGWPTVDPPVITIAGTMLPYTAWPGANALCAVAAALGAEPGSYRQKGRVARYHLHSRYEAGCDAVRQTRNWHTSFPTYAQPYRKPVCPRPLMPDYELLFVVSGHCEILWVSLDGLRASVPPAILSGLEYPGYRFDAVSPGAAGWPAENVALLAPDHRRDRPMIRFDQAACRGQTRWAARVLGEFIEFLDDPSGWHRMVLGSGDLAIFDNATTLRTTAAGDPAAVIAAYARLVGNDCRDRRFPIGIPT